MNFTQYAEKLLKTQAYRLTSPRRMVLNVLAKTTKPLNAYDIHRLLKGKKIPIDTSTVYRILEVYKKVGLVHEVKGEGYIACQDFSCTEEHHCHHQFICRRCDEVQEFHIDDRDFLEQLKRILRSLKIESHHLELGGVCGSCLQKS